MIPQRALGAGVRIVRSLRAGCPVDAELRLGLGAEELIPSPVRRIGGVEVARDREIPGFGVAIGFVTDPDCAMDMRHEGHRPGIEGVLGPRIAELPRRGITQAAEVGLGVGDRAAVTGAPLGIGPVEGRVDGQQVTQITASVVHEFVAPRDADGGAVRGLDRHRRRMEGVAALARRSVAPHCGERQRCRQHALLELPDGDVIDIDRALRPCALAAGAGHRGRDHERLDELGNARGVERSARNGMRDRDGTCPVPRIQRKHRGARVFQEGAAGDHSSHTPRRADDSPTTLSPFTPCATALHHTLERSQQCRVPFLRVSVPRWRG